MTKINAQIVADSISPQGDRLTSLLITFPRFILAEINTHRMLSKNTSSSRAIPFNKMIEAIQNDPFIPIAWQKDHKGMQGSEYITDQIIIDFKTGIWLRARDEAINRAEELNGNLIKCRSMNDCEELEDTGVTKQLCNRLLEPFMWTTMLITGSKEGWNNFFELRCPSYEVDGVIYKSKKDAQKEDIKRVVNYSNLDWLNCNKGQAEIHMMELAECIYDAMNNSTPLSLEPGEWHIPFEDKLSGHNLSLENMIKCSVSMAARTSYTVVGKEKEFGYDKHIELHDRLINQKPLHASPMEHCARAMSNEEYYSFIKGNFNQEIELDADGFIDISTHANNSNSFGWCRNYKGFIQYRHILENEKF